MSPLRRALQTYTESGIQTKQIIVSELFRELKTSNSCFFELEDDEKESRAAFLSRVAQAVKSLPTISGQTVRIALISHEDFIYAFYEALGLEPKMHQTGEVCPVVFQPAP